MKKKQKIKILTKRIKILYFILYVLYGASGTVILDLTRNISFLWAFLVGWCFLILAGIYFFIY